MNLNLLRPVLKVCLKYPPNITFKNFSSEAIVQKEKSSRLSKHIADHGLCSRREAERWISDGRVQVNGKLITNVAAVSAKTDLIAIDGILVNNSTNNQNSEIPKLWGTFKLKQELVAHEDIPKNRPVIFARIGEAIKGLQKSSQNCFDGSAMKPVIRLDYNTEGLFLFSNNGKLAKVLNHPDSKILKHYRVRVNGAVTQSKIDGLKKGIYIDNKKQPTFQITVENTSNTMSWVKVSTYESNCKLLRQCFEKMFLRVTRVIIVGFGPYQLSKIQDNGITELKLTPNLLSLYRKFQR